MAGRFDPTDRRAGALGIESNEFSRRLNLGIGGIVSFNITKNIALETEYNFLPQESPYTGKKAEWFYGVKAGIRKERYGIFCKIRPGYMYLEKSLCDGFGTYEGFYTCLGSYRRNPALDVGGVIEFYPRGRSVVRIDIGDSIVHFGHINRYQPELGPAFNIATHVAGGTTHSLQINFGYGIRF